FLPHFLHTAFFLSPCKVVLINRIKGVMRCFLPLYVEDMAHFVQTALRKCRNFRFFIIFKLQCFGPCHICSPPVTTLFTPAAEFWKVWTPLFRIHTQDAASDISWSEATQNSACQLNKLFI